jgi:hypothetical protein
MYWRLPAKLNRLALERSLGTIACIKSSLTNPDSSTATSNTVISAVLALICYNVMTAAFLQSHFPGFRKELTANYVTSLSIWTLNKHSSIGEA